MISSKQKGKATEIAVEFGNVNIGDETVKIGVKIEREKMPINEADHLFCGRRLTGSVQKGGYDDGDRQSKLFQTDIQIEGTFDVHRFGVGPKFFTTGLTFKIGEIEVGEISQLAKGKGRLMIEECCEIPKNVAEPDDAEETNQTLPGTFKSDLPWRKVSLDSLFKGSILKALKAAGLATVGDYADFFKPNKNGHCKTLTQDVKGLGPAKITEVENRFQEFWRDNPQD